MLWDENVQIWRSSPSGHLAGHKGCCLVTNWVILAHFCWARNYLQLSYEFLRILLIWLILLNACGIKVFNSFSCCVYGSGPTLGAKLCSSQTHLRPLPVQTQGMQLLKLFIQFYYINSHQHYVNVTTEVSHSSLFKNHSSCKSYYVQNILDNKKTVFKTAGAVILQLALKLQKGNNFSVIPI